jgi:hypothetical protein
MSVGNFLSQTPLLNISGFLLLPDFARSLQITLGYFAIPTATLAFMFLRVSLAALGLEEA